VWIELDHRRQGIRDRVPAEGAFAAQHLIQYRAERPDIGSPIYFRSSGLLRRHISGSSHDHADLRMSKRERGRGRRVAIATAGLLHSFGESEVEYLDHTIRGDLDVCGFQIAMNDAALVRILQPLHDLSRI